MSRGLGRTQRNILRYLVNAGSDDVTGLVLGVYDSGDDEDVYVLGPTVRRALYGLARAGLVAREGERRTRTGSYSVVWAATGSGEDLVKEWDT